MTAAPTLNGALEVAIYVDDVARAVTFYEQVLGLTVLEADTRLTAMAAGRQIILVCLRGASVKLPKTAHDASGPQHVAFSIAGADLPAWEAHLRSCGIDILESRAWARGGRSLYFRDPDGHLLELASPGVWSIY
jgi:catechol 2,3-dioxygenase-like lactoylglutathione lyase family enzyme